LNDLDDIFKRAIARGNEITLDELHYLGACYWSELDQMSAELNSDRSKLVVHGIPGLEFKVVENESK